MTETLVNCTRARDDVFVKTADLTVVPLPRGTVPVLVNASSASGDVVLSDGASLALLDATVQAVLFLEPPRPGTWLLVDAEILVRCPTRSDLVAPAQFERLRDDAGPDVSVLTAVYRSLGQADENTPVMLDTDFR